MSLYAHRCSLDSCLLLLVKAASEQINSHSSHRASTTNCPREKEKESDVPDAAPLKSLTETFDERSDSSIGSSGSAAVAVAKAPEGSAAPLAAPNSNSNSASEAPNIDRRAVKVAGDSDSETSSAAQSHSQRAVPATGTSMTGTRNGAAGGGGWRNESARMSVDLTGVLPQLQPPVDTINETLERFIQTPAPAIYMDAELDIEPDLPVPERIIPEAIWKKFDKRERERQKILHGTSTSKSAVL